MKSNFLKQSISKNILMLISVLTIFIGFSSCNKDKPSVINDNYYVKYVINALPGYSFRDWSFTTPDGNFTQNGYSKHWEQTYGPVKKGFNCRVQVGYGKSIIEIHVAKNQEPFALKVSETGLSASYTIDF